MRLDAVRTVVYPKGTGRDGHESVHETEGLFVGRPVYRLGRERERPLLCNAWGKAHLSKVFQRHAVVAFIQQKAFSFRPRFYVYMNDVLQAEIVKDFTLFTQHYRVEGMDWEVNGNFGAHDYEISGARGTVASVHKQWFTWGDCCEICISENENEQLVLAVVLAIDAVMAQSSAAAANSAT